MTWKGQKVGLRFCAVWNTGWGIFLIIGLLNPQAAPNDYTARPGEVQIIAAGFALALYWVTFIMWLIFGREMDAAYQTLSTTVMSPIQIQQQLTMELGRPAQLNEVAAVHQMLTTEHNQQMISAGLTLGGLLMLANAAERSRN